MYASHEYSRYHESYYVHPCSIVPEKDVIFTDIVGNGFLVQLKRWWHDLFLLSFSSVRSRGFYNSSHAMRMERFRQYRKYRSRIHPMSKFTHFWNCVIVFAVLLTKILFRFTSSILFEVPLAVYFFAASLEFIIIIDIVINMMTGYINTQIKRVVLDTKKSLIHYCSTKLFLHMMSAIPMHWLMFIKYGLGITCGLCKCNRFIAIIKILNVFGLYRVFETTLFWTWRRGPEATHLFKFLRIATVGLVTMTQFYDVVDVVWMLTVLHDQKLDESSFVSMLIVVRYGIIRNVPSYMVLCYDISRIFKSFFLFSFGLKRNSGFVWDKISSVIAYLIANTFYAWTILECYSMISRQVYPKEQLMNSMVFLNDLLASRQICDRLKYKIDRYFDFKSSRLKIFETQNGLYKSLPSSLKKEITLSCYSRLIMRIHRLFTEWPMDLIEDLTLLLKPEMYLSNDIVAEAWTPGQGLMIVDVGVLAVYTVNYEETGHLIDGDYFGEISLVTDKEVRMSYVVAVTSCRILILDKLIFRNYMRQYPKIFYNLKRRLYMRNERLMQLKRLGSLLESQINEQAEETGTSKAPETGAGESSV